MIISSARYAVTYYLAYRYTYMSYLIIFMFIPCTSEFNTDRTTAMEKYYPLRKLGYETLKTNADLW